MSSGTQERRYRTEPDSTSTRRVDIVAINYAPEVTGIGPYTADAARRLTATGWDVRVVTGFPHYPQWRPMDLPDAPDDGVAVERVRHVIPTSAGIAARARMEAEFGLRAALRGVRPDAAVVLVSPPLIATGLVIAALKARRHTPPIGVWVQDLYGHAVVEAAGRGSATERAVRALESTVLRSADSVAVAHERFRSIAMRDYRVDADRVVEMRNWNQALPPRPAERAAARARLGLPTSGVIVVHAGNMGLKQGLDNVVAAARLAADHPCDIRFYLVGDGNQRRALQRAAAGADRLEFVDPMPDDEFHTMLAAADVLLVNEKPGVAEMSVPSKLTTYFSAGRPVVAAVEPDGITAGEVRRAGAGVVVPAGDPLALLDAVARVAAEPLLGARLGEAGARYAAAELSADAAVARLGAWIESFAATTMWNSSMRSTDVPDADENRADRALLADRRLADYVVDPRDRGRNRLWMIAWIAVAAVLRSGVGGNRARVGALRLFGADVAVDARIHRSFRVHFPWKLAVGARTEIGAGVWVIDPEPVTIGADCVIGSDVVVCAGGHDHRSATFDRTSAPVRIGDRCTVGAGATVLKGVRIDDASDVAPLTVVTPAAGGAASR